MLPPDHAILLIIATTPPLTRMEHLYLFSLPSAAGERRENSRSRPSAAQAAAQIRLLFGDSGGRGTPGERGGDGPWMAKRPGLWGDDDDTDTDDDAKLQPPAPSRRAVNSRGRMSRGDMGDKSGDDARIMWADITPAPRNAPVRSRGRPLARHTTPQR